MCALLTVREGELLMLIRAGYANDRLARVLGVSSRDLQRMLRELGDKLAAAQCPGDSNAAAS
jgi:DNA-binding CsgD family transcriptional regulator